MQHIGIPSFYFNLAPQTPIRASTYLRAGQNLAKIIARPPKGSVGGLCVAQYRLLTPCEEEQLECSKWLFNNVKALRRDFYVTSGKTPKKLADMYKWAVVEGFELLIQDDELRPFMPLELLHVQLKSRTERTPTLLYFHPAKEDLGSCAHFLMDLACQLHSDIVAFEYPSFKQKDRQQKLSHINETVLLEFARLALNFAKAKNQNEVFLFASGEGAIPCTMLAKDQPERIMGVVYEEPMIEYEVRRGLSKRKEDRFLDMIRDLDSTNIFVFHGMSGTKIPFTNAKSIIHSAFRREGELGTFREEGGAVHSVTRSPSPIGGEVERVVEHYFVDCENYKIREIKRAKLFEILRNFVEEVTQRSKKASVMMSIPYLQKNGRNLSKALTIPRVMIGRQDSMLQSKHNSGVYETSTLVRNLSSRYSQYNLRRDDSECDTTGEWHNEQVEKSEGEEEEDESSRESVMLKRRSIQPRYRIGRHYQLKKKFQQRKETQTSTIEGEEDEEEESNARPMADISLIDPRARYNSMKEGSSLETPFPLSREPSNNAQ